MLALHCRAGQVSTWVANMVVCGSNAFAQRGHVILQRFVRRSLEWPSHCNPASPELTLASDMIKIPQTIVYAQTGATSPSICSCVMLNGLRDLFCSTHLGANPSSPCSVRSSIPACDLKHTALAMEAVRPRQLRWLGSRQRGPKATPSSFKRYKGY